MRMAGVSQTDSIRVTFPGHRTALNPINAKRTNSSENRGQDIQGNRVPPDRSNIEVLTSGTRGKVNNVEKPYLDP